MAKVELNRGSMTEFSELFCGTYFIFDNDLWLKVAEVCECDNAFNFNRGFFEHFDDESVEVIPTESITIKVS